jgi:hypothetical protein
MRLRSFTGEVKRSFPTLDQYPSQNTKNKAKARCQRGMTTRSSLCERGPAWLFDRAVVGLFPKASAKDHNTNNFRQDQIERARSSWAGLGRQAPLSPLIYEGGRRALVASRSPHGGPGGSRGPALFDPDWELSIQGLKSLTGSVK